MVFWRKKKNPEQAEQEERDDRLMHRDNEPDIEPPTEYDPELDAEAEEQNGLHETDAQVIGELDEEETPEHFPHEDATEAEELSDHTEEGGWLSRLTSGLSKSTNKFTQGLSDLITKRKLDEETLEQLEDVLLEADLGPRTAAKIIEDFSKDRFGKEIEEEEIKDALAQSMSTILQPVASKLEVKKPDSGPFVILVCGVNGAGKTTTIGKMAYKYHFEDRLNVMIAAGDTFRAAAVEQLQVWAERASAKFLSKDIGADAAAVAFEAYSQAKEEGVDVLMIDTAGRLQNKKNLMEELEKIIRVLKKQDESIPHATLLVLDATTGQNAFSQVETFKEMVDVNGLIVTKLDGAAKGGVLVGLADQFGVPVYKIGVGEGIRDLQPFNPDEYAKALVGLVS